MHRISKAVSCGGTQVEIRVLIEVWREVFYRQIPFRTKAEWSIYIPIWFSMTTKCVFHFQVYVLQKHNLKYHDFHCQLISSLAWVSGGGGVTITGCCSREILVLTISFVCSREHSTMLNQSIYQAIDRSIDLSENHSRPINESINESVNLPSDESCARTNDPRRSSHLPLRSVLFTASASSYPCIHDAGAKENVEAIVRAPGEAAEAVSKTVDGAGRAAASVKDGAYGAIEAVTQLASVPSEIAERRKLEQQVGVVD